MFRRRRNRAGAQGEPDAPAEVAESAEDAAGEIPEDEVATDAAGGKPPRPNGPWDASEVDLDDPARAGHIDLGGLLIPAEPGLQLQLQVEEQRGVATSVLLVLGDSAVQVLAVAAPRSAPMWPETRAQVAADASRHGGTATEAEGPLGTELRLSMPVRRPDGSHAMQASRMIGVDGPRWLMRARFLGQAAVDDRSFDRLAAVVRKIVVVRGGQAMPPGDVLPLRLPREVTAAETPGERPPSLDDLEPGPTITEIR